MANPEHLEIIEQGVEVWNEWREKNPDIVPDLSYSTLTDKALNHIDLREANLTGIRLDGADLAFASLMDAKLKEAKLFNTNLLRALLIRSDMRRTLCSQVNFYLANITDANLSFARLQSCKFNETNLARTNFSNVELIYVYFNGAFLRSTNFRKSTVGLTSFNDIDLSQALGLDSVQHNGPSSIGIDTLYKSNGKIPELFLRGCGVPESFITQIPALVASVEPIQFYKCFISFTEADDLFSERLYNDLQGAGVRCWRWKEDARWGRSLMSSIDEAVRVYDKLIVICSEQSLKSPAVSREIERALQKEDDFAREGKEAEVLFPIRLDDYIFSDWKHHRKADVVAKNVGDFRQWTEPERYKKAFDRLLRDLKAS